MTMKKFSTKGVITCVILIVCMAVTSVVLLGFVFPKHITIVDSDSEVSVLTLRKTVKEVLNEKNISLSDDDYVLPPLDTVVKDGSTIKIYRLKNFTLVDDGIATHYQTNELTVDDALRSVGVTVNGLDLMSCGRDDFLSDGMTIEVVRAKFVKVTVDGKTHERYTARNDVKEFLDSVCIYLEPYDEITPSLETPITEGLEIVISRVSVAEETYDEPIPRKVIENRSSDYAQGQKVVTQEGSDGVVRKTYNVTRRDGEVLVKTLLRSETITEPVDKIVTIGTKAKTVPSRGDLKYTKVIECTATAYAPGVMANGSVGITASGRPAGPGIVAVDPSVIPLNSRLYIESTDGGKSWTYGYAVAGDTGGAITGNKIDLCFSTTEECYQFGRRQCTVYILE